METDVRNVRELQPGSRVNVFPGLRKHSPTVRISPLELCEVLEPPTGGQPADAVTIRRPRGDVLCVDADMLSCRG